MRRRACALAACAALALIASCWTSAARGLPRTHTRYDGLDDLAERELRDARTKIEAGRLEEARVALAALVERYPENIVLGTWLQEAEIDAISAGAPSTGDTSALDELRARYAKLASERASVASLVLAARLESDETRAEALLARAESVDARCVWVPYARAFLAARRGAWDEVRKQLTKAEALDPGHLPTRWLSCWMLARGGKVREAITSLDTWLGRAREDVRVDDRLVLEAELDLSVLRVLDGDARGARALLDDLESRGVLGAREQMVEAATREALGDPQGALSAAKTAEELAPGEILPVVQQALLSELWLDDPAAAETAWTRVLALSKNSAELSSMLERVRARARLERYQLARQRAVGKDARR